MLFWYVFYIIPVFLLLVSYKYERFNKLFTILYFSILWWISSFRYMYGADYETYVTLYQEINGSSYYVGEESIEPTFRYIVMFCNDMGLTFQSIFVLYTTIVLLFFYKGCTFYLKRQYHRLSALILYGTTTLTGGYFFGVNGIRQAAAMSILFYASRYIVEKKYKVFIAWFCIAFLFHYSSIFIIPLCFASRKKISNISSAFICSVALAMSVSGASFKILLSLMYIFMEKFGVYGHYSAQLSLLNLSGGFPPSTLLAFGIYIFVLLIVAKNGIKFDDRKSIIVYNGATMYVVLRCFTSFGIEGNVLVAVLHRVEVYYLFFYITFFLHGLYRAYKKRKMFLLIALVTWVVVFGFINIRAFYDDANDITKMIPPSIRTDQIFDQFNFDIFDDYYW